MEIVEPVYIAEGRMSYLKQKLSEALHSLRQRRIRCPGYVCWNVLSALKLENFPQEYPEAFSDLNERFFQTSLSSQDGYSHLKMVTVKCLRMISAG
jgi:hypothetical protein